MSENTSILQKVRADYSPKLPAALAGGLGHVAVQKGEPTGAAADEAIVKSQFPHCFGQPIVTFVPGEKSLPTKALNVGVVLSGGQAPGGHNVISGLFDGLKALNPDCRLLGFRGGPQGLVDDDYRELTDQVIDEYRNTGGFDIIGSGRTKLSSAKQFEQVLETANRNDLAAIVVIGGDDSNTNACLMAEWFQQKGSSVQVIGIPKTIDGDLRNEQIETSFGFDTAAKVYAELIGNICRDANSAKKYWHFIKLMGRSASHIALEAALQTHPNICLISEEVETRQLTLRQIVDQVCDVIVRRARAGKNFGVALIPEGLIEFIPEMKALIGELNEILAKNKDYFASLTTNDDRIEFINQELPEAQSQVFSSLPMPIQEQLVLERDSHGNVPVSMIKTEELIIDLVKNRLRRLQVSGEYVGKFSAQSHFFGYEGRCAAPTNFDADYCYSLGFNAVALIAQGLTGYMSCVGNLTQPATDWVAGGVPLTMMMNIERRHGEDVPVIRKALVELDGKPFKEFAANRHAWADGEQYLYPGPIQYFGPAEVCDRPTMTILLERG
jgi:pyrophosphate--fructose-6-phosphate 1-phosphotransferase